MAKHRALVGRTGDLVAAGRQVALCKEREQLPPASAVEPASPATGYPGLDRACYQLYSQPGSRRGATTATDRHSVCSAINGGIPRMLLGLGTSSGSAQQRSHEEQNNKATKAMLTDGQEEEGERECWVGKRDMRPKGPRQNNCTPYAPHVIIVAHGGRQIWEQTLVRKTARPANQRPCRARPTPNPDLMSSPRQPAQPQGRISYRRSESSAPPAA